jgi:hypothetical protein
MPGELRGQAGAIASIDVRYIPEPAHIPHPLLPIIHPKARRQHQEYLYLAST